MWTQSLLLLYSSFVYSESKTAALRSDVRKFPKGFQFGAATAAYQIEGAWNEDGKSESIWDSFVHKYPSKVKDCSDGDIADDSYHQYKRDVEMMRELGLDYNRFSISWTRILPTSFPDQINEAGVQYYNNLIDEMLKYNIEPMVTLYHWDLPQKLQEMGGWANPYIVDWYADYARIAFKLFGDRVKKWITINEPHIICYFGYGTSVIAPPVDIKGIAEYMCAKNVVLAHAKVYHMYHEEFNADKKGQIGITLNAEWFEPVTDSENDVEAALSHHQFKWEPYAHPVFSEIGDFHPKMKEMIAEKSAEQGFPRSRLPEFTPEEGFGLNRTQLQRDTIATRHNRNWTQLQMDTIIVPWGFHKLLTKIREDYNNPPVYITENGFSTHGIGLIDVYRVKYYRLYLDAMLDAIEEGSDVRGYTAWSLMDNYEWIDGYTERFGLYEVDYESPSRTRTPRKSAFVFKEIVRTRALDFSFEPAEISPGAMTIDPGH